MPLRSDAPEGPGYILMVADYANRIPESNEQNNLFVAQVTIHHPAPPDLHISMFRLTSTLPLHAGQRATVRIRINNHGDAAFNLNDLDLRVYYSQNAQVDNNDYLLATVNLPSGSIAAGAAYPASTSLILDIPVRSYLPTGSGHLILVADRENRIAESDESNNIFVIPVTVQH